MVEEARWVLVTTPGKQLRIQQDHWNGNGRVALIGEIDLSNVRYVEAVLTDMATSGKPLTLDVGRLAHPSPPPRRRPDHELRNAANATTSANGRCRQLGDRFGHHWLVSLLHDAARNEHGPTPTPY